MGQLGVCAVMDSATLVGGQLGGAGGGGSGVYPWGRNVGRGRGSVSSCLVVVSGLWLEASATAHSKQRKRGEKGVNKPNASTLVDKTVCMMPLVRKSYAARGPNFLLALLLLADRQCFGGCGFQLKTFKLP